jgi:hypothetical protein
LITVKVCVPPFEQFCHPETSSAVRAGDSAVALLESMGLGVAYGLSPGFPAVRLRVGIQCQKCPTAARMCVGDAVAHVALTEIEALEIACVGGIAETQVDRVRPGVDRRLQ